jgi:hypothetical protein
MWMIAFHTHNHLTYKNSTELGKHFYCKCQNLRHFSIEIFALMVMWHSITVLQGANHPVTQYHIPEEQRPQLHHYERIKTHSLFYYFSNTVTWPPHLASIIAAWKWSSFHSFNDTDFSNKMWLLMHHISYLQHKQKMLRAYLSRRKHWLQLTTSFSKLGTS